MTMDPVRVDNDITLQKTLTYDQQADGKYAGTMTLHFTGTSNAMQYQEAIPKSFASDVKSLTFSVPPDRIIQADPVVAWNKNVPGSLDIAIRSVEEKIKSDAKNATEEVLVNASIVQCSLLGQENDRNSCLLETERKYRDSPTISTLKGLDLSDPGDATQAAVIRKDPDKYCGHLTDVEQEIACRAWSFQMLTRDCNEGPADARPDCIRKSLWQIGDSAAIRTQCSFLSDPQLKAECEGSVNAAYCNGITDAHLRDTCLFHAANTQQSLSLCTGIADPDRRDLCNEKVALQNHDESVCSLIKDPDQKAHCIAMNAANKRDIHVCDNITDSESRAACVNAAGFASVMAGNRENFQNLSFCNTDTMKANTESRDLCIAFVAAVTKSPDTCENIQDEDTKNTCFLAFSIYGETSVCTRITDEYERDACIQIIAEGTNATDLCDDIQDQDMAAECRGTIKNKTGIQLPCLSGSCTTTVESTPAPEDNGSGQECEDGLVMYDNTCVSECPAGTHLSGTTCVDNTEQTCGAAGQQPCIGQSCQAGMVVYDDTCVSACPAGTHPAGTICVENPKPTCGAAGQQPCSGQGCQAGLAVYNNVCVSACPAGTHLTGTACVKDAGTKPCKPFTVYSSQYFATCHYDCTPGPSSSMQTLGGVNYYVTCYDHNGIACGSIAEAC